MAQNAFSLRAKSLRFPIKRGSCRDSKAVNYGDCSIVADDFLAFRPRVGRYLGEKTLLEVRSWTALGTMLPIPPKASGGSRIFPRRKSFDGRAITDDARVPGVDTGRIGFGQPIVRSTIWATRCLASRESWRSPTRNITVEPADIISTPRCWTWPCPTPITPIV